MDIGPLQLRAEQLLRCAQRLFRRDGDQFGFAGPGEEQKVANDPFQAVDLLANDFGVSMFGGAGLQLFALHEQARFDGRERIADFMSHSRG